MFAPENWSLAWYLRDYKKTGYWGEFCMTWTWTYVGPVGGLLALKLGDGSSGSALQHAGS